MARVQTYERERVTFRWAARSEVGNIRRHNEDSLVAEPGLYAVADGMGGHAAGDVASRIVVEHLSALRDRIPLTFDAVDELVTVANTTVRRQARELISGVMGTTLVAVVLVDNAGSDAMVVVNVGDSRCYLHDADGLRVVTHDHSLVQELVDAGQISVSDARVHPDRNVVTRALGVDDLIIPDFVVLGPAEDHRLLLCSDGVSSQVEHEFLESVLGSAAEPDQAVDAILDRVLSGRAPDNATAIVVDVQWASDRAALDAEITAPRVGLADDTQERTTTGARLLAPPEAVAAAPILIDTVPTPTTVDERAPEPVHPNADAPAGEVPT